jgi:hypothetical protein
MHRVAAHDVDGVAAASSDVAERVLERHRSRPARCRHSGGCRRRCRTRARGRSCRRRPSRRALRSRRSAVTRARSASRGRSPPSRFRLFARLSCPARRVRFVLARSLRCHMAMRVLVGRPRHEETRACTSRRDGRARGMTIIRKPRERRGEARWLKPSSMATSKLVPSSREVRRDVAGGTRG